MTNRAVKYLIHSFLAFAVGCSPTGEEIKSTRFQKVEVMGVTSDTITIKYSKMGEGLAIEEAQKFCSEKNKVAVKSEHHKKFGVDDIYSWGCR